VRPVPLPAPVADGQVTSVPVGAADTGDGSTATGPDGTLLALGALGLAAAAGSGAVAARRARRA
jgi:hypothetical protein